MQATRANTQAENSVSRADIARLLIEANLQYREAGSPDIAEDRRSAARDQCRQLLGEVLGLDDDNPQALGLLGRIAMDEGNLEEARACFHASIAADPADAQLVTNLGYLALVEEAPETAEKHFQKALALDRQSAAAFCGIAHAKRLQGQYDQAFLHYRRLLELGVEWPSVYSGMMQCAPHLHVDRADQALARDALRLLARPELPHQNLGRFVAAILRRQYNLDDPEARIVLDEASQDALLILALERTLLPDAEVEELITLLRQAICLEVRETGTLRDALQPLAIAIGIYAQRVGYALLSSDEENVFGRQLTDRLHEAMLQPCTVEDLCGAMIVQAMYGALFTQPYASRLGGFALADWPAAMQPLMQAAYFDLAAEESHKQAFVEKEEELVQAREDIPRAWPSWSNLQYHTPTRLRDELQRGLGVALGRGDSPLRVMVLGAESGERALEIARYFTDVEVVAVDEELANVGHIARRARNLGIENLVAWPYSLATRFVGDGHPVDMIELGRLPSPQRDDVDIAALVTRALNGGGLVHFNTGRFQRSRADRYLEALIQRRQLSPTLDNIRRLRKVVFNTRTDGRWLDLLQDPAFYAAAGCRARWFFPEDEKQVNRLLSTMSNEVDWKLVRVRDTDGQTLEAAPVLNQLRAQHLGSGVRSLVGHGLSLYFQRRR